MKGSYPSLTTKGFLPKYEAPFNEVVVELVEPTHLKNMFVKLDEIFSGRDETTQLMN